jgi:hypothetical protein
VEVTVQLNVIGQNVPAGHRLRLALSQSYWPVIWPTPARAHLALTGARLELPLHAGDAGATFPEFGPPEGAPPLAQERLQDGASSRTLTIDMATGEETQTRRGDTGRVRHLATGMEVSYASEEIFTIHPEDPTTARGTCRWKKYYRRGDWRAELDTEVTVEALADIWRITARLEARDADGTVATRDWAEDIPRDMV